MAAISIQRVGLLAREVLRERVAELIAEVCAWSVGLSDSPHYLRRSLRVVASGSTLGDRAIGGLPLGSEESGRLDLAEARPGTFADALNALAADGTLHADRLDHQVIAPFVLQTCVLAAERSRERHPAGWTALVEELGEDPDDLPAVVRVAEWEAPVSLDADVLVLSALGDVPLVEVEAEGLPLSLVRAAEAETRRAAPDVVADPPPPDAEDLAGALFLAQAALDAAGLPTPVPPERGRDLLDVLLAEDLEPVELVRLLPSLPVQQDTIEGLLPILEVMIGN